MTLTDIEGALNKCPFVPFDIHLESGRVVPIPHPEFLLLDENKATAVIVDGARFRVIDVEQISFLRPLA